MLLAPKLFAMVLGLIGLSTAPAQAHAGMRQQPLKPARPVIEQTFTGYGTTAQEAEQNALEQAREWLETNANPGWVPPPDYLRQKSMVQFGEARTEDLPRSGRVQTVQMRLEVTASQVAEMRQLAREERMTGRHWLLARLLAGALAVVLVCGGYLRLEEATRGYYTVLLRAVAAVLLALVGAGLWLVA